MLKECGFVDAAQAQGWASTRSVTMRLTATEKCVFDRKAERKVDSTKKHVTEYITGAFTGSWTSKTVYRITEWFWKFNVVYELSLYKGNDPNEKVVLLQRSCDYEIVTTTEDMPRVTFSLNLLSFAL